MQRDRIVRGRMPGRWQTSSMTVPAAAPPASLRSAFAPEAFSSSAESTIRTLQPPRAAVACRPASTSRTWSTGISRVELAGLRIGDALQHPQVGVRAVRDHAEDRVRRVGSGALRAQRRRAAGARSGRRASPCRRRAGRAAARHAAGGRSPSARSTVPRQFRGRTGCGLASGAIMLRRPAARATVRADRAATSSRRADGVDRRRSARARGARAAGSPARTRS